MFVGLFVVDFHMAVQMVFLLERLLTTFESASKGDIIVTILQMTLNLASSACLEVASIN